MTGKTILFVDDDVTLGRIVTLALEEAGYKVCYQNSLDVIMETMGVLHPDIIILDVEVGERSGIKLASNIMEFYPNIPILFVSSHIDEEYVVEALKSGGVGYLRKPLSVPEVIAYVNRFSLPRHAEGVSVGAFTFKPHENNLFFGKETTIRLSPLEGKLLKVLLTHVGKTVPRAKIEELLWADGLDHQASLNNLVHSLRNHLKADPSVNVVTHSSFGYSLIF